MPSIINALTAAGGGVAISGDATGNLALQTAGNTAVTVTTSSDVGMGTTTPTAATGFSTARKVLQVTPSGGGSAQLRLGGTSGTMIDHDDNGNTITTIRSLYGATSASAQMQLQSGFITFGTGTSFTESMRISSAGYVTMPNQPAFLAYRSSGVFSGTGIYICDTVTFNDGSHYNSSTGRFTAPVAGRYQLNFFVLAQNPDDFDLSIFVNGSSYSGMEIRCNSNAVNSNFTLAISGIIKLSANDIVDPRVTSQPSGSIFGSGLNGFSMYLLG